MSLFLIIPMFVATFVWFTYIVWFSLRAKWWRHSYGINNILSAMVLVLILLRLSIASVYDGLNHSVWVGALFYVLVAFLGVQRIVLMERAQRERHTDTTTIYMRRKTDKIC